jgi:crotonobetainyl-CoA:carnitine CoA-transferase CaiB-like acyl-CoA transferase
VFSPLAGVRVLDFTTSLAGPYCTLVLGALGADVLKIEHPERGDDTRTWGPPFWNGVSATYLALNANKRSLAVDLKRAPGLEVVLRLAASADVFVQNMRPGLAERVGLGFDAVRERNPRVVYCSIGAFGRVGPLRHQPGYDPLMQAAGGIMSVTGEPGRPPTRAGVSVVDQGTGLWSTIAILAAIRARDAGAGAQLIDTSLYETAVNWLPYQIVGYLGSGEVPRPMGSGLGIIAPYEAFAARDAWVMIAAGNDRQFAALCEALGDRELAVNPRFRTNPDRVRNREELAGRIGERFATEEAATWLARLDAAGVPAAPVQDLAQVLAHEQTQALGVLQPLPHPEVAELRLVAPPFSVRGDRVRHTTPAPALGEHSEEILGEVGYRPEEIDELRAAGVISGRGRG